MFALPSQHTFLNYLRCHDDIGWGLDYAFLARLAQQEVPHKKYLNDYFTGAWPHSPARGALYNDDESLGDARLCGTTASLCGVEAALESGDSEALFSALTQDIALHALMFSLSGVPVLYGGDEIATRNDWGYLDDPLKAGDSRYIHRPDMDWVRAGRRREPQTPEAIVFNALRRLEALRSAHPAFDARAAVRLIAMPDDALLGLERAFECETLYLAYNFAPKAQWPFSGDGRPCTNLWTGEHTHLSDVQLPPLGFVWLALESE